MLTAEEHVQVLPILSQSHLVARLDINVGHQQFGLVGVLAMKRLCQGLEHLQVCPVTQLMGLSEFQAVIYKVVIGL